MSSDNETADTIHNAGKVQLADALRLMTDNQRTLDVTNADDRRSRDLHARTEEAMARAKVENLAPAQSPEREEDMRISIDSPTTTTVNHNYPAEEKVAESTVNPAGLLAKGAVIAALLAGGIGAGVAVERAIGVSQPPPAVETPVDNDTRYESRIEYLE